MGHYKSNLRDIEFNLFEVFGRDEVLGTGPVRRDRRGHRAQHPGRGRAAGRPDELAESLLDADRNPPVFDPATHSVTLPESFKKSLPGLHGRRVVAAGPARGARRHRRPAVACAGRSPSWCSAPTRRCTCTPPARPSRTSSTGSAPRSSARSPQLMVDRRWGATMVLTEPDAGSDVGAGRTKADPAGRRHLAHRGRQAVHHLGRARPDREHRPPGAGPPRGRRPGHQGPVAVHRPEVPLRLGDRRARRAQRRLRHQRRAQDGPEGLHDLRAHLRRAASRPSAGWSARCTTASRRCSRSSSTPG